MINCQSLKSNYKYSFKDPNGNWHNTNNKYNTIFTEGNVQVTVAVTAKNNGNFVSVETQKIYTTEAFRK